VLSGEHLGQAVRERRQRLLGDAVAGVERGRPVGDLHRPRVMAAQHRRVTGQQRDPRSPLRLGVRERLRRAPQVVLGVLRIAAVAADHAADRDRLDAQVAAGVEREALSGQRQRAVGVSGQPRRVGGLHEPLRPQPCVARQPGRALERRGGCGVPAAQARALGRARELVRDLRVRRGGRGGAVPGAAVGVGRRAQRLGERGVRRLPLRERRAPVCGRADERVAERQPVGRDPQ
jgi:hypothetical protein